ncbi:MAG: ABC transporter permease [Vicinamibacterales bacterium]
MSGFWNDLKHGCRVLLKTPAFTLSAVIVLALGIGANTAIFSIVNGVLLRPLPYTDPDRLVQLWHTPPQTQFPGMTRFALSAANYLDWQAQNTVFSSSAVYRFWQFRLTGSGEPQMLRAARVEPTFFTVLGTRPLLGHAIDPSDDTPERQHVVVLSHRLWNAQFGGDAQIVGKTIHLDGDAYTVIGVMPASFAKPESATLWVPLVWTAQEKAVRGEHSMAAVARLKPGVTVQQAQAQLDTIAARIAQQYPADSAGWGAAVVPLREETVGDVRKPLLMLLGAVVFVLLIACANVANLMLARTVDRRKEIAIRTAFGARRARIIRQVLSESLLIAVTGGALGLVVASFGTELVVNYFGASLPRLADIRMDGGVLAFAFATALVSGTVAGVAPAWRMSKSDPNDALKQGLGRLDSGSTGKRTRAVLVVTEVALSLVLLVGAALMIRTLWNLRSVHPGFVSDHVLTMRIGVAANEFAGEDQQVQFYDAVLRRVRALPGVQYAGVTDDLPLEGGSMQPVAVEGQPVVEMAHQPEVSVRLLSPQFMKAMGIPILRGREFTDADTAASAPVVLVSESMARQFWPNQDPIGKRLTLTFFPKVVRQVVGVVGDVKDRGLDNQDPVATLYWPLTQFYAPPAWGRFRAMGLALAVRTGTDPASVVAAVRNGIHEISPSTPLIEVRSMDEIVAESLSPQRFNMLLFAAFAGLALVLAAVGLYSVVAYATRQRVKEIGIRMALGADRSDVLRGVVLDGLRPTLIGIGIGTAAAMSLSHVLATLIYGVKATDASTYGAVAALLGGVGVFASIIPAYRATLIDPVRTLRDE